MNETELLTVPDDVMDEIMNDYYKRVSQLATNCLICGELILISRLSKGIAICEDCKRAIIWAKEKMKEKDNELQ